MSQHGKIDREFFDSIIYPHRGAERDDAIIGPQHGFDYGVLDIEGSAVVVSTDPISILPDLGFPTASRFALEFVLADVAVSGIAPTHLTVSFTLPPVMTDDEFAAVWRGVSDHAYDLGVSIVAGHTARYSGVDYPWIGAGTTIGVGELDALIRPDGAQPNDVIVVSGVPAGEVAGLFATLFPDALSIPEAVLDTARTRLNAIETVRDALVVADAGSVTAIHDVTEGGLTAGLIEMARAGGVRFDVASDEIRIPDDVRSVCSSIDVDPWQVTSAGTLLVTAPEPDATEVIAALESRGTPAVIAGEVTDGDGVLIDGEPVTYPESDPSLTAYSTLSNAT